MNTALKTQIAITGIPSIGTPMPGGVFAGVMPAYNDRPAYGLILAPGADIERSWGPYGKRIEGLSDWDGKKNTELLVEAKTDHPAAQYCADMVVDDCNDFYLPARDEARLIFASARGLIEGDWHWTSSQCSAYHAFVQGFSDGDQSISTKVNEWRVRAVRRFLID